MMTPRRYDDWFCGPGEYFWTSEARLVDLELGYCTTRTELEHAVLERTNDGRETPELGGSAYRTHAVLRGATVWPHSLIRQPTPAMG
ncbi:MAG: hypothetical protein HQL95_10680 [Magnetococcales bacterium]|nr:hypothetical protein [Magnetococcales bacterium]